uniref:Rho GTPase-activating protein 26 n=1 Tax=Denticeps clupeoides TaxID=299321 RepID=A0AAY4ESL2_9TELE
MGLPALEFSDCYLDSPQFRERLKSHELELDKTNKFIKELIKDGKALIQALKNLSAAKRKFAESLNEFKFQCIGDAETDDEICIGELPLCSRLCIENANDVLIAPLERFRKEQIGAAKEAKKKYDKETEKYCAVLEKHLSLSAKKKEAQLHEADNQVDNVRQHFYEVSLEYVFKVQEVQERKMFEFVEPLLAFLQGLFTYYHHGYELAKDFNHFKTDLTISIQNTRNRFESTRSEVESLMRKMKENPDEHKSISPNTMEGYLFVQEKRSFVSSWVKYYCTYHREPKRVTMVLFDQKSGGRMGEEESFILKSCTRRKTDSIEKRFCFDVEAGLYRIVGVNSRVQKLLGLAMDPKTCADVELEGQEWEIKTITSAIKHYLRCVMLPAPLMTYQYQRSFIKAAKLDNPEARAAEIHNIAHRLPEKNRQMLELLMKHLANVASHHQQNLMTVANLGVVFGPTLLRPQEETVAAIMDIKFQNIVVEILIENHERVSGLLTWFCVFMCVPVRPPPALPLPALPPGQCSPPSPAPSPPQRLLTPPLSGRSESQLHAATHNARQDDHRAPLELCDPRLALLCSDRNASQWRGVLSNSFQLLPVFPNLTLFVFLLHATTNCPASSAQRKARALYACKAEHDSELSFIAGTVFENVHPSREPGWLEGTLDGRTGLIPENYVEFL